MEHIIEKIGQWYKFSCNPLMHATTRMQSALLKKPINSHVEIGKSKQWTNIKISKLEVINMSYRKLAVFKDSCSSHAQHDRLQ